MTHAHFLQHTIQPHSSSYFLLKGHIASTPVPPTRAQPPIHQHLPQNRTTNNTSIHHVCPGESPGAPVAARQGGKIMAQTSTTLLIQLPVVIATLWLDAHQIFENRWLTAPCSSFPSTPPSTTSRSSPPFPRSTPSLVLLVSTSS